MAAEQSPVAPDPTAPQVTRPADSKPELNAKAPVVRTALWAVGVTVLSNAANILKQLRDVAESLVQIQQFALEHFWISSTLLTVVLVWGNVLLFRFLYHRSKRHVPFAYKILAWVGCVALVGIVLVTNLFSLRSLLHGPFEVQRQLASELAATQDVYGGGFRNAVTAAGFPDTWTTAQAMKALLSAGTSPPEHSKEAFAYVENYRQAEGFDVIFNPDLKGRFIRTEVAAWVALAYLESLKRSDLWSESERAGAVTRTVITMQLITAQQDRLSGGWGPVPLSSARHPRTYATTMALWAITEALLSPDISQTTKDKLVPCFETGILWLLNHYQGNLGWEENPAYALGKSFPGLTYQVLFVLERAQKVSQHNSFENLEAYKRIKREFSSTVHPAEVGDQTSVPTEYIMEGPYPCAVDVLAFPWLLSVLPALSTDPDVPARDRRYLRGLLRDESSKIPELPPKLLGAETWQVAENLIGISSLLNSRAPKKN